VFSFGWVHSTDTPKGRLFDSPTAGVVDKPAGTQAVDLPHRWSFRRHGSRATSLPGRISSDRSRTPDRLLGTGDSELLRVDAWFVAERATGVDPVAVAVGGHRPDLVKPTTAQVLTGGRFAEPFEPRLILFDSSLGQCESAGLDEVPPLGERSDHVPAHRIVSDWDQAGDRLASACLLPRLGRDVSC
jgi:hypothetical protein